MENVQNTYYLMKIHRSLWVLDETRICNTVGGNKLRKLQYILKGPRPKGIITMGSKYSSHCMAAAYWGMKKSVPVHLIIICDEYHENIAAEYPYLRLSVKMGAELNFVSNENAYDFIENYKAQYADFIWIPGGGHTIRGLRAYKDLLMRIFSEHKELRSIDWILLPYGTGTTALGITAALQELGAAIKVMGISVSRTKERCLKAAEEFLSIGDLGNLLIDDRFAGKYGQRTTDQDNYFAQFLKETGIMVDPIYNIRSVQYYYDENLSNGLIINTGGTGNLFL